MNGISVTNAAIAIKIKMVNFGKPFQVLFHFRFA